MKSVRKTVGALLYWGSGLLLFVFWFGTMTDWLGAFFGSILAIILSPGLVVFPIIYWVIEGVFPTIYFVIWGIGLIGIFISASSDE